MFIICVQSDIHIHRCRSFNLFLSHHLLKNLYPSFYCVSISTIATNDRYVRCIYAGMDCKYLEFCLYVNIRFFNNINNRAV